MASINKVILVGNVGKDPEVITLESGIKLAKFPLATTESYTDRQSGQRIDNTTWHNIVMWRNLAEIAEKYVNKGKQIYVEGKIKSRKYTDKEGNERYITEIEADNFILLGKKDDFVSNDTSVPADISSTPKNSVDEPSVGFGNTNEADDDLPF